MPTIFTAYYPPARNLTKSNILNKRLAAYQYDDRSRSSREVTPSLAAARMRTTKASLAMRPLAALAGASALAYVLLALTTPAALLETPALRGAARNHSRLEVREMRKALEALRSGINELDAPAAPKPVAAASSPTCTFRAYVRAAAPGVGGAPRAGTAAASSAASAVPLHSSTVRSMSSGLLASGFRKPIRRASSSLSLPVIKRR